MKEMNFFITLYDGWNVMNNFIFNICKAFHLQMHLDDFVWILQDHQETWWKYPWKTEDCKVNQLKQATEGLILVSDVSEIVETSPYGLVFELL